MPDDSEVYSGLNYLDPGDRYTDGLEVSSGSTPHFAEVPALSPVGFLLSFLILLAFAERFSLMKRPLRP